MNDSIKKILTIGGGSGQYALLAGLRDLEGIEITSVVSMADNGGSTGRLRDELGILPPGDALKCALALSPFRKDAKKILLKKLNGDRRLKGHNAGNMLLTMLSRYTGSFPAAIQALGEILESQGRVLPVTTNQATLVAELADGTRIYGETAIDIPQGTQREEIKDLFLVPHFNDSISLYPPVYNAIDRSDAIFLGPGDLFTSTIATLIVPGLWEALEKSKAKIFYIVNIMTKFGETHGFTGNDFVKTLEKYIPRRLDGIICNTQKPVDEMLEKYKKQRAEFVEMEKPENADGNRKIHACDLLDTSNQIVRHDPVKLASLINRIIFP
jgi:uncharacterized cofD-like protein